MVKMNEIVNGTIIRLNSDKVRDWVCISKIHCSKSVIDQLRSRESKKCEFILFGGLWGEGDPLSSEPYCKLGGNLTEGMLGELTIVGHIDDDLVDYIKTERLNK